MREFSRNWECKLIVWWSSATERTGPFAVNRTIGTGREKLRIAAAADRCNQITIPGSTSTPIQAAVAGGSEGAVGVLEEFAGGLKDLEGFERIWLLYWLDRAKWDGQLLLIYPTYTLPRHDASGSVRDARPVAGQPYRHFVGPSAVRRA